MREEKAKSKSEKGLFGLKIRCSNLLPFYSLPFSLIPRPRRLTPVAFCLFTFALCFVTALRAQDLPDKIRGYKVQRAKIAVKTADQRPENPENEAKEDAFVTIDGPELKSLSLTGLTFELTAELDSVEQSGEVDFLTFHDFRVNGLKVDIEEYGESFKFEKNQTIKLPKPFEIFLSAPQTLLGALGEITDSKEKWRVTGRVFVFGRFKKAGFKFKRVVPVEIDIMIKNPARK
ncbi:MAG: hypothetical protein R2747_20795 [Pyrinomonadaceae bacterium]